MTGPRGSESRTWRWKRVGLETQTIHHDATKRVAHHSRHAPPHDMTFRRFRISTIVRSDGQAVWAQPALPCARHAGVEQKRVIARHRTENPARRRRLQHGCAAATRGCRILRSPDSVVQQGRAHQVVAQRLQPASALRGAVHAPRSGKRGRHGGRMEKSRCKHSSRRENAEKQRISNTKKPGTKIEGARCRVAPTLDVSFANVERQGSDVRVFISNMSGPLALARSGNMGSDRR